MRFEVRAAAGNAAGVFDAAYEFGDGAGDECSMMGTAEEVGREVARFLATLTPQDVEVMKCGTDSFSIQLTSTPLIDEGADSWTGLFSFGRLAIR